MMPGDLCLHVSREACIIRNDENNLETTRGTYSTHVMDTKRRSCGKLIGVATALDWC